MVLCWCCCLYLPGSALPQRQWVCGPGLMWDTQGFPSRQFDVTPDKPSAVLLSSVSPHLTFAFWTIPFSLPSRSRGKWICLQHTVQDRLQALGMAPFFHHLSKLGAGGQVSKTPQQWGGLPAPRDLPLLHPHSSCLIPCSHRAAGHLPTGIASPKAGASGATRYPGALSGRMSACDSVIISMATVRDSLSSGCSRVLVLVPGARVARWHVSPGGNQHSVGTHCRWQDARGCHKPELHLSKPTARP